MRRSLLPLALGASLVLAGCAETPMGPTVSMLPSPGKDFALFQGEQQQCESYAAAAVHGQASRQNRNSIIGGLAATALGAGLGAAIGGGTGAGIGAAAGAVGGTGGAMGYSASKQGGIQRQYDNQYVACMVSKGNILPGAQPIPGSAAYQQPRLSGNWHR